MKRNIIAVIMATTILSTSVLAGPTIVFVDNQSISSEYSPEIINGTTFLPIRVIAETLGLKVNYDANTKTINVDDKFTHKIGTSYVTLKNGKIVDVGSPSYVRDGRTYVSIRLFSEALGYEVTYDPLSKDIWINTGYDYKDYIPKKEEETYYNDYSDSLVKSVYSFTTSTQKTSETIKSTNRNESAVIANNGANVVLTDININKTGHTSSVNGSVENGLNSSVLIKNNSGLDASNLKINSDAFGSDGVFGSTKSNIKLSRSNITTNNHNSMGLVAIDETNVTVDTTDIKTDGNDSAGIYLSGGKESSIATTTVLTEGENSPILFTDSNVHLNSFDGTSNNSNGVIIEGGATVTFNNSKVLSPQHYAISMYQKDAIDKNLPYDETTLKYTGGSLSSLYAPLMYFTNTTANVTLNNVKTTNGKTFAILEKSDYGTDGATLNLSTTGQNMIGDFVLDDSSKLNLKMSSYSYFNGAIDPKNSKGTVVIDMDSSSTWDLTGNSYVDVVNPTLQNYDKINSNTYNVYYDADNKLNYWLDGKTKLLNGNGKLIPMKK